MAMSRLRTPRPLTAREREVLEFLCSIEGPEADVLKRQAATARVTASCECGCGAIDLEVDRTKTEPADVRSPIMSDREDPDGEVFSLMLWDDHGWIDWIELAWLFHERGAPPGLPSPEGFDQPSQSTTRPWLP
jgi:hypothetical protein